MLTIENLNKLLILHLKINGRNTFTSLHS